MARQKSDALAMQYAVMLDRLVQVRKRRHLAPEDRMLINRVVLSLLLECRDAGVDDAIDWL